LGGAALGGAEQGGLAGGVAGAGASLLGSGISALRGDDAPEAGGEGGGQSSCHSFTAGTAVLMADGSSKPISQVKIGDKITDAVPGQDAAQAHTVTKVIVTTTDHDFVDLGIAADSDAQAGKSAADTDTGGRPAWAAG
jgi:hypothetical protein